MNEEIKSLVDAPLANALALNIVGTPRKAKRAQKPVYEGDFAPVKVSRKQLAEMAESAHSDKVVKLLDYYSSTNTPFDRIAQHMKMTPEQIETAMAKRGRKA